METWAKHCELEWYKQRQSRQASNACFFLVGSLYLLSLPSASLGPDLMAYEPNPVSCASYWDSLPRQPRTMHICSHIKYGWKTGASWEETIKFKPIKDYLWDFLGNFKKTLNFHPHGLLTNCEKKETLREREREINQAAEITWVISREDVVLVPTFSNMH